MTGEFVTVGDLGGYYAGGDPAGLYPELWEWLIDAHDVRSMIDVGCGDGQTLRYFEERGCTVLGVDGVPQDHPAIIEHDYTLGPYMPGRRYDLAWSCEFVEHVEEQYVSNFLETFRYAGLVLITHAVPGQAGHHHVNCRNSAYWIDVFASYGFKLDTRLTDAARELAEQNQQPENYFARTGLVFS